MPRNLRRGCDSLRDHDRRPARTSGTAPRSTRSVEHLGILDRELPTHRVVVERRRPAVVVVTSKRVRLPQVVQR